MTAATPSDDDAEAVLQHIEENGAFDELRQLLIGQLRENVRPLHPPRETGIPWQAELEKKTFDLILQSKHLPLPTDDKRTLQMASEAIRRELTSRVRELMVNAVWAEMARADGQLAKDIQAETHSALCKVYERRLQAEHDASAQP